MLSLKRVKLSDYTPNQAALVMYESNGIILEYDSLECFKNNFNKYILLLTDFKDKIKALGSLSSGAIFEGNVSIMSRLEDKLDIPLDRLFISSAFESEIKEITEFYFDDINDGSFELDIMNSKKKNPFNIIEWILMSNLNGGVNLSVDMNIIDPVWLEHREIFDTIYPYVNSFCYKDYIQVIKDNI